MANYVPQLGFFSAAVQRGEYFFFFFIPCSYGQRTKRTSAPDFVAVVDFDRDSPDYGKVLRTVPLRQLAPAPSATSRTMSASPVMGGRWRSVACSASCVVRIRSSSSTSPIRAIRRSSARTIRRSSITDELTPLSNGGFLVTFMGGPNGAHPGRVVEYDAALHLRAGVAGPPPTRRFNPHGISIDEAHSLMVTSDFICPLRTLHVTAGAGDLRGSVRVWDLARRAITKTITVGDPGARPARWKSS